MTVSWQKVSIPLAAGVQNRTEARALEPPALEVCRNAEFDELGGIRKRRAFSVLLDDETGGDPIRRIVPYGDELVLFTSEGVYSYDEAAGSSVKRATYLAAAAEEASRFTRTSEQAVCDRAELSGVVVLAWKDEITAATVKFAAYEKATGAVLLERTITGAIYPRLIATTNRILLFYAASSLKCLPLDVSSTANLATSADATAVTVDAAASTVNPAIDVSPDTTATRCLISYRTNTATMTVKRIDETGSAVATNATGRTVNDATAIAISPGGGVLAVRNNGVNIEADLLAGTLADSTTAIAVGTGTTTINQIAAAFKATTDSGQYRCHIVWSSNEQTSPSASNFACQTNYVDDAGTAGTASTLARNVGVASRAFEYTSALGTSRVLVWLAFATGGTTAGATFSQLQNGYFLYDLEGGGLHAKAIPGTGGGFSQLSGYVPSVQDLGSNRYACSLIERRSVAIGKDDSDYAQRSPREVIVQLDDDRARRCARIGATLYVAGAQVSQYDGVALHELGFPVAPYYCDAQHVGGGSIPDGTYTYKTSVRWENAKGDLERSTSYAADAHTMNSAGSTGQVSVGHVPVTSKLDPDPALEVWRTAVDPVLDSPFYLATAKDPTTSGDNGYLENDPTAASAPTFGDDLVDGPLTTPVGADYLTRHETFYENGGVLANLAPPSATIIAASSDRLWLAGIPGNPRRVVYSKLRGDGELAAFNDALFIDLPVAGGAVTAVSLLNDTPVAFCERGIYALIGGGFDNLGGGQNFQPRLLSSDVGAKAADAVGITPEGVIFLSSKGWHLLDRGLSVRYIGAPVSDFDADDFYDVSVMADQHQIRCFGSASGLVLDTVANQWSEWQLPGQVHAAIYRGRYLVTDGATLYQQELAHGAGTYDYSLDLETAWIKLDGLQGFRRVRKLLVLGEYRSAHRLRVQIAYDFDDTFVDDFYWTPTVTTAGDPEQVEVRPSRPKGQSLKLRLTCRQVGSDAPALGEALKLTGLTLEVGAKRTAYRALPAAQKV